MQIGLNNVTPGYSGYPSSYDGGGTTLFTGGGMGALVPFLGAAPDGYVGNATVTTSDPAPSGDLKIHSGPSASAPQIGGADKDAIVEVVTEPGLPPGWAKVGTFGSSRNPQVTGYASLAYLTPIAGQGQVEPATPGAPAVVVPTVPGVTPVAPSAPSSGGSSNTMTYVILGLLGLGAAGAAYYYFGD